MDGKRRAVTSSAEASTAVSIGSVSVAEIRKKLFQLRRLAAGYILAALSSRIQRRLRAGDRFWVRKRLISSISCSMFSCKQ